MGAAYTSICQELSRALWGEPEVIKSFGGSYKTCMRCACAHLGWKGPTVATGGHGLEGQMGKVSGWSRKVNTARRRAISSRNQLLKHA